jgi:hypothetical protein
MGIGEKGWFYGALWGCYLNLSNSNQIDKKFLNLLYLAIYECDILEILHVFRKNCTHKINENLKSLKYFQWFFMVVANTYTKVKYNNIYI